MKKWDLKKNTPIYYDDNLEDIIEYVCLEMYQYMHGVSIINKLEDVSSDDDEDNNDVDDDVDACIGSNTPIDGNNTDEKSNGSYEKINEIDVNDNDSTIVRKDIELMK